MSVWAGFLSLSFFLPRSSCPSVPVFTDSESTIFISPSLHRPFSSCLPCWVFRLTFLLFCRCRFSFYYLHPCPFCLCSVVPIPLFLLCWLPCLSFAPPFSTVLLSPSFLFFLPLALISAQFPSHSLSLCCNLNYAPPPFFFPNVTILYLFFPLFFRVTSFSVPLSAVFFSQVSVRRGFTFSQDRQPVERGLLADQRHRL